jgi:glycine cleavage system P protein (glycine dehydrogenase) subunit 1
MPFIPHTPTDVEQMLAALNLSEIAQLFEEIPAQLPRTSLDKLPEGMSECAVARLMQERQPSLHLGGNFLGAGAYEHYIPAAIWDITSRGEFLTAYTPYQAEASQGTLQLIYEYQTMMARLMGMEVANASLYDGASALAEAILMAQRLHSKDQTRRVLVPRTLHPAYRQALHTILKTQEIDLIDLNYTPDAGCVTARDLGSLDPRGLTAVVIPQPNFFGVLEDVDLMTDFAHQHGALAIAVVNPIAMALLKEPGSWGQRGADIACGEGQPLGIPLASGGPYFGFMCCRKTLVRQLPGRIVGRTHDAAGRSGFTLTLQTREQHIRRAKATSNICTNQGLLVTAATIYLSLLGAKGLRQVAAVSHTRARELLAGVTAIPGVQAVFDRPIFHEFVIRLPVPVEQVLTELAEQGICGGYALKPAYPELPEALLVCVTETKTPQDLIRYQQCFRNCCR